MDYPISCVGAHIRSRQGHPPSQPPSQNTTLHHQIIMQEHHKFWKAAGLEQVWRCTAFLRKWCKMLPEWPMRTPPPPTSHFHTYPDCLRHMCMLCMVGSGYGASKGAKKLIGHVWEVQWWKRPSLLSQITIIPSSAVRCVYYGIKSGSCPPLGYPFRRQTWPKKPLKA